MNITTKDCVNGIFLLAFGRKREKPSRCCFVCSKIPGEILKRKRTSYCAKIVERLCVLCHVSKFITHKQTTNYMQKMLARVLQVEGVENDDD